MTRTSTLTVCESPTRSNSRACSTRSSFACSAALIVPTSSRNSVPRLRLLDAALPVGDGARERAAHVAEQLGLEQRLGNRAAVDRDEALTAPRAARRECARAASSLPVPVSPVISTVLDVAATVRSSSNSCSIDRRPADDAVDAEAILQLRAQVGVLRLQPPLLDRRVQLVQQLFELERLGDESLGAEPRDFDRLADRAEAGDDDGDDLRDSARRPRRAPAGRRRPAAAGR